MTHFICRYGNKVFLAFMFGGLVCLLLVESVFNGGFDFSTKILWLPLGLLIFGYTWVNRQFFYIEMRSVRKPWLYAVMLYPMAILLSWLYMMLINAVTSSGDALVYRGPVEHKWVHHGGVRFGDSYEIDIRNADSSEVVTITVTPERYASISKGDVLAAEFKRGGFGIPFRWRFHKP